MCSYGTLVIFARLRLLPSQTQGRILRLSRIHIYWRNNGSQSNQLALTLPLKRQCNFRNSKVYPALPSSPYQIGRAGNILRPYSHCAIPLFRSCYDTDRRCRSHKLLDITGSSVLDLPFDRSWSLDGGERGANGYLIKHAHIRKLNSLRILQTRYNDTNAVSSPLHFIAVLAMIDIRIRLCKDELYFAIRIG